MTNTSATSSHRPNPASPLQHIDTSGTEDDYETNATPSRPHTRVRTPPPLARAVNRVGISDKSLADSDDFFANLAERRGPTCDVQVVPTTTTGGPTTAEFITKRATEIREIKAGRKWKPVGDSSRDTVKGAKSVRGYSEEEQALMYVMRASMQYTYAARSPWGSDEDDVIKRAKDFAKEYTTYQVDDMVSEGLIKTVSSCVYLCFIS
jgi:hypothetical protein